jgi:hypothetical protein
MVTNIKAGKSKKDRIVTFSSGILDLLRLYSKAYQPKDWLTPSYTYVSTFTLVKIKSPFGNLDITKNITFVVVIRQNRSKTTTFT